MTDHFWREEQNSACNDVQVFEAHPRKTGMILTLQTHPSSLQFLIDFFVLKVLERYFWLEFWRQHAQKCSQNQADHN